MAVQRALSSRDPVEVMVQMQLAARTWEQFVEFTETERSNLAAELNNGIVKAFGG